MGVSVYRRAGRWGSVCTVELVDGGQCVYRRVGRW